MVEEVRSSEQMAEAALGNKADLETLAGSLSESSRRTRQQAAAALSLVAQKNAALLVDYSDALVDALNCKEAQTRWECLDALTCIVDIESRACDKAVGGAENALFDEGSGPVRLAAMRFLCKLGSTTPTRSEKVWPLIDEGIQCYHGDLEFQDMLVAVIGFSEGKLAGDVSEQLADRMRFDATNGKGVLQKRAAAILENLK